MKCPECGGENDEFESFMKIRTVGEKIQSAILRGRMPRESKEDLIDAETMVIAILKEMGGK